MLKEADSKKNSRRDRFTLAFDQYYQIVFNAVYTRVNNKEDAQDICQEVFILMYKHIDEIYNLRAWLFTTLKNVVKKYYRDREPNREDIEEAFDDVGLAFINGFKDTRIILKESIDESVTSDDERLMIDLIAYHTFSYNDVAMIKGWSKRKVEVRYKKLVQRILFNLRKRGISNIEDLL